MTDRITDEDVINRFESHVEYDVNERGCDRCTLAANCDLGYRRISIDGRKILAHRASYRIYTGPIPDGMQINHHCDHPWCVSSDHLYAGTASDNMKDMWDRDRHTGTPGVERPDRLDEWQVAAIHRLAAAGIKQRPIASLYDLPVSSVCDTVNGELYNTVDVREYIDEHVKPIPIRFASIHNNPNATP